MIAPPKWTDEQLEDGIQAATSIFRRDRMQEPLQSYLDAFERYRESVGELLAASDDLANIDNRATEVLTKPNLLEAFRYFAGPPLSADDLKTLSEGVLSPAHLRKDPDALRRIVEIVRMGLDRRRFPWAAEIAHPPRKSVRRPYSHPPP